MLNWPMTQPGVHLTATLSGGGTDVVDTVAYIDPIGEPPPELQGLLTPVRDPTGAVGDRRMAPVQASLSVGRDDIDRYRLNVHVYKLRAQLDDPVGRLSTTGLVAAGPGMRTHRRTQ